MTTAAAASTTDTEPSVDAALARAVVYSVLATGFRRPEPAALKRLLGLQGREALRSAADWLDRERLGQTVPLSSAAQRFLETPLPGAVAAAAPAPSREADAGDVTRLALEYDRLFGHSRGLVCPFETEYGPEGGFQQPQALADLAGSYRAFGLRPTPGADERVDHVACECEFMEFLARKEAYFHARGRYGEEHCEARAVVRDAARGFLREHLGRFGRAFAARLAAETPGGWYGALGDLLFRYLGSECERFGVPAGPATLSLRAPDLDDAPMACGTACNAVDETVEVEPHV